MEQGLINKFKVKMNRWFSEPLGFLRTPDSTDTEFKKPFESLEPSRFQSKQTRGRGDKREIPHRIEEFHPRGAAGHREARGPRGPRKAAMPHRGNRSKYPKGH